MNKPTLLALVLPAVAGCVSDQPLSTLTDPPKPLSGLLHTRVEVNAYPGRAAADWSAIANTPPLSWDLSIQVDADREASFHCPKVTTDVTATLDGEPLKVAFRNGVIFDDSFDAAGECLPIGFVHVAVPHLAVAARAADALSTLVITDGRSRWTIEVANLMTDDLGPLAPIERGTTNLLAWPSAPSIDGLSARVGPYVPTYRGDDGLHWEWDSTFDVNQMTVVGNQIAIPIGPLAEVPPNAAFLMWGARSPVPTFDGPERCTVHVMNVFSTSI